MNPPDFEQTEPGTTWVVPISNSAPIELAELRETAYYRELRPYIKQRVARIGKTDVLHFMVGDEKPLDRSDRFYVCLDFIVGDIFRNVHSRQWIKTQMAALSRLRQVDSVGAHTLYRSYINELVVMMERLQRITALLVMGFGEGSFVKSCEEHILGFFHPLLFKKRNENHHGLYLGYANSHEIEQAVRDVTDKVSRTRALTLFRSAIARELAWFEVTEKAMATFLHAFFENMHSGLKAAGGYQDPARLPVKFDLQTTLRSTLRKKHKHDEVFKARNPVKRSKKTGDGGTIA